MPTNAKDAHAPRPGAGASVGRRGRGQPVLTAETPSPKTLMPPQIAPCKHHQSTDDDPKNLPPAEARRPPQSHLISEQ